MAGTAERGRGDNSRGNKVYLALLAMMRSGELPPGTRMREDEIATQLGVSRTPVREAFARLHARGLVDAARGGWTVAQLTRPQVMELYAMRAMLEGASARFAAENASPSDLMTLRHAFARFNEAENDPAASAVANARFHEAISDAAHNGYLNRMLQDLNDSLALLPSTTFSVAGRRETAEVEHGRILEAIEKRDPEAAERAARSHIEKSLEARLELLFDSAAGA